MLSKEELEALCKEYYPSVLRYCMSRLSKKQDAEDAAQETFAIFSKKGHMLEKDHVKPWLFATAHHMILKEYVRRSKVKDRECVFDEDMTELSRKVRTFEEDLIDHHIEKYINDIYARLSDRDKQLFDLCCDGTLKTGQIAQILGLEPHACSMRKKRLKEKCREIMFEILFY